MLDTLRNRKGLLSAGQLNGTFAVWARCNPYPRCQVFRYDIATGSATALPVPAGKIPYAPAVNEYGTAYYMQSDRGCGKSVQLMKQRLTGPPELLSSLPQGRDVEVAYAHVITRKQPRELVTTRDLLRPAPVRKAFAAGHLPRRGHRPAPGSLARDDHVFEVLPCAAAGTAIHVAPVAGLDREAGPVEDLGIELAPVVDDDHDRRPPP